MGIREQGGLDSSASRYDASHAAEVIAELDAQYAAGEIERHAYLTKKSSLVRLYLKATTAPRRRPRREENYDGD